MVSSVYGEYSVYTVSMVSIVSIVRIVWCLVRAVTVCENSAYSEDSVCENSVGYSLQQ